MAIAAAVLAYALSPNVRHAVSKVFHHHRQHAPALTGQLLYGPRVTLSSLHGHGAVVVFWSQSCNGCSEQAPALAAFARAPAGRGHLVAVLYGGQRRTGERLIARYDWRFPNLRDPSGQLARKFGLKDPRELPVAFVLGPDGELLRTLRGPQTVASLTAATQEES
ncbi:MAG: peroxiredoxin family protein [Acidimicrobiales bacterium]